MFLSFYLYPYCLDGNQEFYSFYSFRFQSPHYLVLIQFLVYKKIKIIQINKFLF